uniref:GGDEF domain-containing protein n=1 Tax=candidate division CPR3 bacterium TaxID=2268181 RepID=A0A7C4R487_UNCC3
MKTIATNNLLLKPTFGRRVQEFADKSELLPLITNGKKRIADFSDLTPEDIISLYKQGKIRENDAMFWLGIAAVNAEEKAKEQEQLATMDALTQVYNRRAFMDNFSKELNRLRSKHLQIQKLLDEPMTLALVMVDIDFFKKINDNYGHLGGDQALRGLADIMSREVRATDMVFRYGGEEFAILLPDTDHKTAMEVAERIRKVVKNSKITVNKKKDKRIKMTLSLGVATIQGKDLASIKAPEVMIPKLIKKADDALYYAKLHGRDQVVNWTKKVKDALKNQK